MPNRARGEAELVAGGKSYCLLLTLGALAEIERYCERGSADGWLIGSALSQADITVSCAFTFLRESLRPADLSTPYRRLAALTNRCEAMPAPSVRGTSRSTSTTRTPPADRRPRNDRRLLRPQRHVRRRSFRLGAAPWRA